MKTWYSLIIKKQNGFQYIQNNKGQIYKYISFDQANDDRIYFQADYKEQILIVKETQEILNTNIQITNGE